MIKAGSPEDMDRMMARLDADKIRPMDDSSPIRDFPKYGRPLVCVNGIYGKAVAWSRNYGLIEWLDVSGKYHLGWAQSANIKRVAAEEWKGGSGL
ncbi:hypothetical protein [Arthrobacter sp. ES3-54]|uniref:hypothetical protein n=1 Tax=Arthrobacter sp. ES3-54 TaxID=1502991 RepID=UPI00240666D3|nr:hypothetical protein [Arthrobacter sp. ES3-54]MDF9752806.1 hypothetical protein [Arthrobacter sp. ES3-54]